LHVKILQFYDWDFVERPEVDIMSSLFPHVAVDVAIEHHVALLVNILNDTDATFPQDWVNASTNQSVSCLSGLSGTSTNCMMSVDDVRIRFLE